jgi:peptidyl-prolyl cis-trans isomerase D
VREAPPASRERFPAELGFPRQVQQEVFRLSDERHFSDPLNLNGNLIVLVYRETLPAFVPPLEEIRDTVAADYVTEEQRRLLAAHAEEIRTSIRQRMAEGASFEQAAQAENLEVRSVDRFSRASPPQLIHQGLLARLEEFRTGDVSAMIPLQNHGFFVHLRERHVPEVDTGSDEFVRTTENLAMWSSMARQSNLVQEVMERELGTNGRH